MNCLSQAYRQACRDIKLSATEKALIMRLLREISVNAVRSQKAWHIKEDFMTLWFISAGRFPELAGNEAIVGWVAGQLPFKLTQEDLAI
jgi:hypothetical protein